MMLEWVEVVENQEDHLLDKAVDPQHPLYFIIEAIEEGKHIPSKRKILLDQNVKEGAGQHRGQTAWETKDTNYRSRPLNMQRQKRRQ